LTPQVIKKTSAALLRHAAMMKVKVYRRPSFRSRHFPFFVLVLAQRNSGSAP